MRSIVKIAFISLIIGIIMGSFTTYIALAQIQQNRTRISKYWRIPYSAIIFKDEDGYTVAIDKHGMVISKSTNSTEVILSAIDNIRHGTLLIRNGIYYVSSPIRITHNGIKIIGESKQAILKITPQLNKDMAIIVLAGSVSNVTIMSLTLDGSRIESGFGYQTDGVADIPYQSGVFFEGNNHNITIADLRIIHFTHHAIWIPVGNTGFQDVKENIVITRCDIYDSAYGIVIENARNIIIESNIIKGVKVWSISLNYEVIDGVLIKGNIIDGLLSGGTRGDKGILLSGSAKPSGIVVESNVLRNLGIGIFGKEWIVSNNYIEKCWLGMEIYDNSTVIGNVIVNCDANGIKIPTGSNVIVSNNRVIDCNAAGYTDESDTGILAGISTGTISNVLITNNILMDTRGVKKMRGIGTNSPEAQITNLVAFNNIIINCLSAFRFPERFTEIGNNQGFITENSGYVLAVNGTWVAHGLAGTPTEIILTPYAFNVTAYVVTYNSTHFMIGLAHYNGAPVTTQVKVAWIAKYEP